MRPAPTVGIIGGNGWLGHAFARAMLAAGIVDPPLLTLSSRSDNRGDADLPGVRWTTDNQDLVDRSDVVMISVRPEQFPVVRIAACRKLLISVMAGVSTRTLRAQTQADLIVRAMPNAAATIGASYTPWFAADQLSADARRLVQALLESCGTADEVPREADIDYLTGLTGSGPAFPALLADAMIGHAVSRGLPPELARRAVRGVVVGASQLLTGSAVAPAEVVRRFCDYRGTTAAALRAMIDGGFSRAIHAGLDAAEAKAIEMANSLLPPR